VDAHVCAAATLGTTTVIAGSMADYEKVCSEVDFLEWKKEK
jgi:hypothetical protein